MTTTELEKRLTAVENELTRLKNQIASAPINPDNWVEAVAGTFANDPIFDDAMRLGQKWRQSHRAKSSAQKSSLRRPRSRKNSK
jgi:hypothetical protein